MSDGGWIKVRDLRHHYKVKIVATRLKVRRNDVIGALVGLWHDADRHADKDFIPHLTPEVIDADTEIPGLAAALQDVNWIEVSSEGVRFPRYTEQNGDTAKKRQQKNERQARWRAGRRAVDAPAPTGAPTEDAGRRAEAPTRIEGELEKEKEKKSPPKPPKGGGASEAEAIYAAYPRKIAKHDALKAIGIALRTVEAAELLAAVQEYARARHGKDPNLTPYPATWFNRKQWEDDRAEWWREERPKGQPPPSHPSANGRPSVEPVKVEDTAEAQRRWEADRKRKGLPVTAPQRLRVVGGDEAKGGT